VTRLDGFTVDDVVALIDRGGGPEADGAIVLDQRAEPGAAVADRWMTEAAEGIRAVSSSTRVILDDTRQAASTDVPVIGYYSWGSVDRALRARHPGLRFTPGALAATLSSSDARTFEEPPAAWIPAETPRNRVDLFAGTAQSLVGDLVRAGVTGVAGNVSEPLLQSAVRPQILFAGYLSGHNLAESFYRAMPHLGWQTVIIGDPLCRPFAGLTWDDSAAPESVGELPAYFAERRLQVLLGSIRGLTRESGVQILQAEARRARDDRAGAKAALRRALEITPDLPQVRLDLALLHETDREVEQARGLYREILAAEPRNALALNNLAYSLSNDPAGLAEARQLAARAYALAPKEPTIIDTHGWLEYQTGNRLEAVRLLQLAAKGAPANAEIRLHAAIALAGIGALDEARKHLEATLAADPAYGGRAEVAALRKQLGGK
jgi:Flp pilus assembly protein TadD